MTDKIILTDTIVAPRALIRTGTGALPSLIAAHGERASRRFIEFFTANIRNKNTRMAYARAVKNFFDWWEGRRLGLDDIGPMSVAAYIEQLGAKASKPTVKQHLAAIRQLFDYLVTGGVLPSNPATSVRGPKYVVKRGKTPVLSAEEARKLIDSIDTSDLIGLRDRGLIGVMVYSFARVGATVTMRVEDYFQQGKRSWLRLHEKGGRRHEVPCHHNLEEYLDAWLTASGIGAEASAPLFPTLRHGKLAGRTQIPQQNVYAMLQRRAKAAGIATKISCHSFRATGITVYLQNGGKLEVAQQMAGHESARTTGLYDRRNDAVALDEVKWVVF